MNYRTKQLLIILLTLLAAALIGVAVARAAPPTWPSISPSYRCQDGLAYFTLANVGTDMQTGSQWYTATPHRIVDQGIFWLAAGGRFERVYNAPHIPLTLTYTRPDNGQPVSLTQTCAGVPVTPEPTPEIDGQTAHKWYFPLVATDDLCIEPAH